MNVVTFRFNQMNKLKFQKFFTFVTYNILSLLFNTTGYNNFWLYLLVLYRLIIRIQSYYLVSLTNDKL